MLPPVIVDTQRKAAAATGIISTMPMVIDAPAFGRGLPLPALCPRRARGSGRDRAWALLHPSAICLAYFAFYRRVLLTLFEFLSRRWFRKSFQPPTRSGGTGGDYRTEWSDWLLFFPFVALMFLGLFALGEVGDCLGARDVWHGLPPLCPGLPK